MSTRIELPYDKPLLNPNNRPHWAAKNAIVRRVRRDTAWLVKAAKLQPERGILVVEIHYRPKDHRTRDSINLFGDLKACVDGIRDAGLVVDDDISRVSTPEPKIHPPVKGKPGLIWLELSWTAPTEENPL